MTENKQEPTFELHDWFDGGDIFFRSKDKKRLAQAVVEIVENDLSVALIGSNEVILDHYCRMLVARMRGVDGYSLEVFLPLTTESLLTRFNDMLTEITMEQAVRPPSPEQPVRLLVVNDARMVNEEQWALLVRLLADFPGVNARLVLVINKSGWPAHEKLLNILGKKMHRWMIEVPAVEEARELLDAAVERGYQTETEALLIDAGLGTIVDRGQSNGLVEELDPDLPEMPELDVDVLLGSDDIDEPDTDIKSAGDQQSQRKGIRLWPAIMLLSISLAVSLLVISWLYPDALRADGQAAQGSADSETASYTTESIAIPSEEQLEAKRLKAQAEADAASATPAKTESLNAAPVSAEAINREEVNQDAVNEEPVNDEPANDEPTADELNSQQTETQKPVAELPSAATPAPSEPAVVSPLERALKSIAEAPRSAYFVQHIVLSTELAAKGYIDRYPALSGASVVPVLLSQKNAYAVVSGPFDTRSAAALFTQNSSVPDDYWIRGAAQLQAILRR
jgi:cell division septation protein DedD